MNRHSFLALILLSVHLASAETLTKVRIDFVETLAPRDTTSSVRFQKEYESAINLGKSILKSKLSQCGYELDTGTTFYEASDALRAKEIATQLHSKGSWLIVGPRRSNHYLLLVQGAAETPTVSLMASADDISKLGNTHTSLSPTNSEMARIAVKQAKLRAGIRASYVSVVSDDCTTCVDFAKAFDRASIAENLSKLGEIKVRGDTFDLEPIRDSIQKQKPTFVLLPNYSKVAVHVMGAFNNLKHPPLFIGGDGWGDQRYGFVHTGVGIDNIIGITVRGFPPVGQGLQTFALGRKVTAKNVEFPFSGPGVGILKIIDETASTLCAYHPKNRDSFASEFGKSESRRLRAPMGVSIYELKSGETTFKKTVGVR